MTQFELAVKIIQHAFKDRVDKGGSPYVGHLHRVAGLIANPPHSENVKLAALLHDLLEDCPEWTEGALRALFPASVVDTVVVLTRKKGESYEQYIERIKEDEWATMIKEADLIDNMDLTRLPYEELTDKTIARLKKYHNAYRFLIN